MWWLLLAACGDAPDASRPLVDRSSVATQLTGNFRDGPVSLRVSGASRESIDSTVSPVRFSLRPGFEVSGALWTPTQPTGVGVVIAHGHYGQGKSGAEAQEIAHRLAGRGAHVLAVDTPGVEEWSQPGRHIHFAEGAHNRGWLLASGTSALALQVDVLRRGLDVLETLGVKRMGVAGASGGAVQAFYTAWLDSRIQALAMVSVPRIPREAAAGGCACDQVPGHPGPDPSVLASVKQPLLWLSEVQQDRPEGLAETAAFVVSAGPHSYTADMQKRTLDWFEEHLGLSAGPWVQSVPGYDLSTGLEGTAEAMPISQLPVQSEPQWSPNVQRGGAYTVECQGDGPVVVVLGRASTDALLTAGFSVCSVSVPVPPGVGHDELALAKSIGTGKVRAESIAGAVQAAAGAHGAVAVWGHRAWGVVAAMTGLPFVVEDPVLSFDDLDPAVDAPWVHVPGAWTGAIDRLLSQSLASGEEPSVLVSAISRVRD